MLLFTFSNMAIRELLVIIAFATLVCSSEIDEVEQNKRGVEKATSLNIIPTGAHKQDYIYNSYSHNPNSQNSPSSQSYQNQVSNSFYPNQASSQYYSSGSSSSDTSSYSPQPQVSHRHPQSSTPFVPLNFVPSFGYQSKYHIVSSKPSSNIQLSLVQPNGYPQSSIISYPHIPQTYMSPTSHQVPYNAVPQFSVSPHYQPLSFGGSYVGGQPSTMMVFAQPNPSSYNNMVYPNPVQSFYNSDPSNSQAKYSELYSSPAHSGYDKVQETYAQNSPKEDNELTSHNVDYTEQSDTNYNYKKPYSGYNSYAKV